jgi:hypothetical protein
MQVLFFVLVTGDHQTVAHQESQISQVIGHPDVLQAD